MLPSGFTQELLNRTDIVDIIRPHLTLKRGGANWMGLCPFHGEKSPSFSVSPSKQFYYCFGCGASGDAISFLIEHLGMNFMDAVKELASRAGMTVPNETLSDKDIERQKQEKDTRARLHEIMDKATRHYKKSLRESPSAIAYLKGRELTGQTAARFDMGYAPAGWHSLASVFPHYDDPDLVSAGLVIESAEDAPQPQDGAGLQQRQRWDRFRDRIIFPIRSVQGQVIGFGGRVLGDGEPKYLNSPETPLFSKGRELYGLFEARTAIRKSGYALLVEGYMDVVALSQHGVDHAVATLGTACTADHLQKILRFTDDVVFSFDGDAAGRRAAGRAMEAALSLALDTRNFRFLFLPPEHDPDSFVRAHGAEAFEDMVSKAHPLSQQLTDCAKEGQDLQHPEGRARFLARARPWWNALPEGGLKAQLIHDLARAGGLPTADLLQLWSVPPTRSPSGGSQTGEAPSFAGRSHMADPRDDGWTPPTTSWKPRAADPAQADRNKALKILQVLQPSRYKAFSKPSRPGTAPWEVQQAGVTRPFSQADLAVRLLLLNSHWWEQIPAQDQAMLQELPAPHGGVLSWLDQQWLEHGPLPWASLRAGLQEAELLGEVEPWMSSYESPEDASMDDLLTVLDRIALAKMDQILSDVATQMAHDPSAVETYRQVQQQRLLRKQQMDLRLAKE